MSIENAAEYSFLNNTLMTLHAEDGKFNHNINTCVTRLSTTEACIGYFGIRDIGLFFLKGYWDICVFFFFLFWDMGYSRILGYGIL